jgi:hypothetical protein
MRLVVRETIAAHEWDNDLCSLGGSVFHTKEWADYNRSASPNVLPLYFTLRTEDDGIAGLALGFRQASPRWPLSHLTGTVRFDTLPVVRNNNSDMFCIFIGLIERYARSDGCVELELGSYASRDVSADLESHGYQLLSRMEFEFSLDLSDEELFSRMKWRQRNNLKKAEKMGLKLYTLPADRGVAELRRLQAASSQRIMKRGGPDIEYKNKSGNDPLFSLLESGIGRIVVAERNGEILSANFYTCFNKTVYLHHAGHCNAALEAQAPTFLIWECIRKYRCEGALRFNLGGCASSAINEDSSEHGVYVYKKGFGAKCINCSSGHKILHPFKRALYDTAVRFLRR